MGRNKRVPGEDKAPAMTTYVPNSLKARHQKVCALLGVSLSDRIRKLMIEDCETFEGGHTQKYFDFEEAKDKRLKYLLAEEKMKKLLVNQITNNRKSAYETMCEFACHLGTDHALEKDIETVLAKLHGYDCTGREPFNHSTLETFIEYLEDVIERRKVEEEIKLHRRQSSKLSKLEAPLVA